MMLSLWVCLQILITSCLSLVIEVSSVEDIVNKPFTLLYFYAPGCLYCDAFSEDFKYISHLYYPNPNFQIVQVNGRLNQDLRKSFDVNVFPTLKLYDDVSKRAFTFSEERSVENLQKFIKTHAGVEPPLEKRESAISMVHTVADVNRYKSRGQAVIIAFVDEHDADWTKYHYPDHFYNSLAKRLPNVLFLLHFIGTAGSYLMETYHVSNTPSLVMIKDGHIGIHNSLSTNPLVNDKLDVHDIEMFMDDFSAEKGGVWFENPDCLANFARESKFVGHLQKKAGMNIVKSRHDTAFSGMSLEEQYERLLEKITL